MQGSGRNADSPATDGWGEVNMREAACPESGGRNADSPSNDTPAINDRDMVCPENGGPESGGPESGGPACADTAAERSAATLPAAFVAQMQQELGEAEGAALCAALDGAPCVSVRFNPDKQPGAAARRRLAAVHAAAASRPEDPYNILNNSIMKPDDPESGPGSPESRPESSPNSMSSPETAAGCTENQSESAREATLDATLRSAPENASPNALQNVPGSIPANVAEGPAQKGRKSVQNTETQIIGSLHTAGRIPWCADGYYLSERPSFTLDPAFHAGAYYVQEPSSQFVGHLLRHVAARGARILDLCAAPGGKTTLYASLAGPDGLVVANEIDRRRARILADNVRKWGTGNTMVVSNDPSRLARFESRFDIVAVDAPCSGEGMFRKDPQARTEWSERNVRMCAARQEEILRAAWQALAPGGTLLYSTCTFNRTEDERTLEAMLAWAGDEAAESDPIAIETSWSIVCGRVGAFRTFRFFPHRTQGEGFFAATLRKAPGAGGRARATQTGRSLLTPVGREVRRELERWVDAPETLVFAEAAGTLYAYRTAQFEEVKSLAGSLAVLYSGVAMGQLFKGRLKPDPALAFYVGLNRGALPVAELSHDEAVRYLRKGELRAEPFAEGMNLVCAGGLALGFAKRIGNRVNNLYPNSLRILMGAGA